jgi:hypothetical protein
LSKENDVQFSQSKATLKETKMAEVTIKQRVYPLGSENEVGFGGYYGSDP